MKELETGSKSPDFTLPDSDENLISLKQFRGQWVVLYFYPKDNTSGCTLEAIDFTKALSAFKELNAVVLGVSPDSPDSHCGFRDRHQLKITLLSDINKDVLKQYDVWRLKNMYGRSSYGVERSTFLIDPEGRIAAIWRKVKVPGHIQDVREKIVALQNQAV